MASVVLGSRKFCVGFPEFSYVFVGWIPQLHPWHPYLWMSIPKTGSRRIEVDGRVYRWRVRSRPTYGQGLAWSSLRVAVEPEDGGRVLVLVFAGARPDNWMGAPIEVATPAAVASAIRDALAAGWRPSDRGGPAFFNVPTGALGPSLACTLPTATSSQSSREWEPYDPEWLVRLASAQQPGEPWLPAALRDCVHARNDAHAYVHFVDPGSPGWKVQRNIALHSEDHGTLVLDVLEGDVIGGIEFLNRL